MINEKCQESSETYTIDDAIAKTGYGRFHYKIFIASSLCLLCAGFQNGLTSYVFSAALCDLDMSTRDLGLLNIAFLLGGILSNFLWGIVADTKGRKKILIWALYLDAIVTLLSSFMYSLPGVIMCRFLSGILMACPGSVTFTYLAEFHPPSHQAKSITFSGVAFIFAWVVLPILAYIILPLNLEVGFFGMDYSSWRLFLVVIAVPELIAALCLQYLCPESPRYLNNVNQGKALKILARMYRENTGKDANHFVVEKLAFTAASVTEDILEEDTNHITRFFFQMITEMKRLYSYKWKTFLTSSIMFCNMFGYLGLGIWLPEFFIQFEEHHTHHPNATLTLSELTFSTENQVVVDCGFQFDLTIFRNTIIVSISAMICNILAGVITGKVSVKNICLATMIFGSLSSFSMYFMRSSQSILIASSIFQSAMATGNMVIGGIIVELFPTTISAIAIGTALCIGRIGSLINNILFSTLIGKNNGAIILIVGGILLLGAVFCLLVPRTSDKKEPGLIETSMVLTNISANGKRESDSNEVIEDR